MRYLLFVFLFVISIDLSASGQDYATAILGSAVEEQEENAEQQSEVDTTESDDAVSSDPENQLEQTEKNYQALVSEHTQEELLRLLTKAEAIHNEQNELSPSKPVVLVLYGDEISFVLRKNYRLNKSLVDLMSRLEALDMLEVKSCNLWMAEKGVEKTELPSFIKTVPVGKQEIQRLDRDGYISF